LKIALLSVIWKYCRQYFCFSPIPLSNNKNKTETTKIPFAGFYLEKSFIFY